MPTKIQWTHPPGYKGETWNPVSGCTKVSPGCANCYAESMLKRFPNSPSYSPSFLPGEALIKMHPDRLDKPLHWRDPRCVFVNSVSDLFHEEVPFDFVDKVFAIMCLTPQHQYIVLTKRPERMLAWTQQSLGIGCLDHPTAKPMYDRYTMNPKAHHTVVDAIDDDFWPLKNVWIGTSIENQYWMKQRGDIMKEIDWPNKLVSFEPLVGPIDPTGYEKVFQWFIIGGESGPGARPMHPLWGSQLWHNLIPHAPGFWKQWGQWAPVSDEIQAQVMYNGLRNKNGRRVHFDPKRTKGAIDDRYMLRAKSTQVYGGEWTEGRDIHQWPESMKLQEVKA